jgi:hypothetical protein
LARFNEENDKEKSYVLVVKILGDVSNIEEYPDSGAAQVSSQVLIHF